MKLSSVIAIGGILASITFAPAISYAQDTKADKKDIRKDQNKEARNKAQRNEAIKKGEPKKAVKDEKKVHADKKDIRHDKKAIKAAK